MPEVMINIANRSVVNLEEFRGVFRKLKDGMYLVTVKDMRRRSIPQNAYYWGVVVPMVKQGLYDAGYDEVRTNDDAHEVMKHLHLRKRIVSKQTGDTIDIAGSSRELSVNQFSQYIEDICRWSAQFLNVVIPSPNEQFVQFEENMQEQWQQ